MTPGSPKAADPGESPGMTGRHGDRELPRSQSCRVPSRYAWEIVRDLDLQSFRTDPVRELRSGVTAL